jgi:hypothetical protein
MSPSWQIYLNQTSSSDITTVSFATGNNDVEQDATSAASAMGARPQLDTSKQV